MLGNDAIEKIRRRGRVIAEVDGSAAPDEELGPFALLPGQWANLPDLPGRGWNMIALPFANKDQEDFRLLLNQYDETLDFTLVDKGVPNRGITQDGSTVVEADQFISALQYVQNIPKVRGLPIGVEPDTLSNPYFGPYAFFHQNPFQNLFEPTEPTALLTAANQGVDIERTITLSFDTTLASGGIVNIPFIDGLPGRILWPHISINTLEKVG